MYHINLLDSIDAIRLAELWSNLEKGLWFLKTSTGSVYIEDPEHATQFQETPETVITVFDSKEGCIEYLKYLVDSGIVGELSLIPETGTLKGIYDEILLLVPVIQGTFNTTIRLDAVRSDSNGFLIDVLLGPKEHH